MSKVITLQELRAKADAGEELLLVEALAPTLLPDRDAQIVVYCSDGSCPNSAIAAAKLAALGYTDVRRYHEGKAEWRDAGLPFESGPAPVHA